MQHSHPRRNAMLNPNFQITLAALKAAKLKERQ